MFRAIGLTCTLACFCATASQSEETGETQALLRDVESAFKAYDADAIARLSCRAPPREVLLTITRPPDAFTSAALDSPPPSDAMYAGSAYRLKICFESAAMKELCLMSPVKRRAGALCIE